MCLVALKGDECAWLPLAFVMGEVVMQHACLVAFVMGEVVMQHANNK